MIAVIENVGVLHTSTLHTKHYTTSNIKRICKVIMENFAFTMTIKSYGWMEGLLPSPCRLRMDGGTNTITMSLGLKQIDFRSSSPQNGQLDDDI